MRIARAAVGCALLLLSGCALPRPSMEDYLRVMPRVIAFAEADGRANAPGQPARGPLFLDTPSFASAAWMVTQTKPDSVELGKQVRGAIGRPYEEAVPQVTMTCDRNPDGIGPSAGGCWVDRYGVFVHLNFTKATRDRMEFYVAVTVTSHRTWPTEICQRTWRLTYERAGGAWPQTDKELIKSTCG